MSEKNLTLKEKFMKMKKEKAEIKKRIEQKRREEHILEELEKAKLKSMRNTRNISKESEV